ncbi:hypothetical protein [Mesorhizobium sp. M0500]|uniref:hypothetical protein n=1 Tax=Mesorhizobium sp. M0500 TaxID=2956953 RepID=UPI0033366588
MREYILVEKGLRRKYGSIPGRSNPFLEGTPMTDEVMNLRALVKKRGPGTV